MAVHDPNDRVYNGESLAKWFFIGSFVLLVSIVWAAIEDYDRQWKGYVRQHHRIETTIGQARLAAAEAAMDKGKLAQLLQEQAKVESEIKSLVGEAEADVEAIAAKHYKKNQEFQFIKGEYDAMNFDVNNAFKKQAPNAKELQKKHLALRFKVERLRDEAGVLEKDLELARARVASIQSQKKALHEQLDRINFDAERFKKAITKYEASLLNVVRNAPVIDMLIPSVKINQIILPDLFDNYYFNMVPRVDRCVTCHATVDKAGFEDFPQPYKTHPKLEQYLSSNSPHPMEKIGCTVCHAGVPQAVEFSKSAHIPKNSKQESEWKELYGFYRDHHIDTPMVPTAMTEGKCYQCHAGQIRLANAPTYNAGMELIENYGCYNCHKVKGHFEELAKTAKSGPTLKTVASKVQPDWIKKWLWDPKSFRPSTKMPSFWQNHNNSDPNSLARGAVEVDAITHFLVKKSKPYEPIAKPQLASDIERGKAIVGSVGCLGCHAVDDFPRKNPEDVAASGKKDPRVPMWGPELNQLGSKVTEEWLYSWLKNPSHYWAETRMPSMRLSDQEAIDVSAYLLTKKNESFEALSPPEAKDEVRDQVILQSLNKSMSVRESELKLASMSLDDRKMWLGEKMLGTYGCYGCHAIEGFEGRAGIGAELTLEGSKDLSKFAFNNVHNIPHNRIDWIYTKIRTPRIFDVGVVQDFESKLVMPHFGFNHEQATALTAVVAGFEIDKVNKSAKLHVDGRWQDIIRGQQIVRQKNCMGCHLMENMAGGDILAHYQGDPSEGPPNLNRQGQKTRPEFLFGFLKVPYPIRPWVKVRMPTFNLTDEEATSLTRYFAALDKEPYPFYTNDYRTLSAAETAEAAKLVQQQGCTTCHHAPAPGEDVAGLAPVFDNVKVRLKGHYVTEWLKNPDAIMPGTRMPALWPAVDPENPAAGYTAVPGYFGDDAIKQMEMVRNYLYSYGGAPKIPAEVPVPRVPTFAR